MLSRRTVCRVIYADTDNMGVAYYANYLKWFEIGRTEMLRSVGCSYKDLEATGIFLPVSEAFCKYISSAHYDDLLTIESTLDNTVKAGMKFDYTILDQEERLIAKGYTKHPFVNADGKVVRPPKFLTDMIKQNSDAQNL